VPGSDGLQPSSGSADPTREPAGAASERQTFEIRYRPAYLTANGVKEYEATILKFAVELGAELDRLAVGPLSRGEVPEHTRDAVVAARAACERKVQLAGVEGVSRESGQLPAGADGSGRSSRTAVSASLLTLTTVGLPISSNFLEANWQLALFALLILCGVIGLSMTWIEQRKGGGGA